MQQSKVHRNSLVVMSTHYLPPQLSPHWWSLSTYCLQLLNHCTVCGLLTMLCKSIIIKHRITSQRGSSRTWQYSQENNFFQILMHFVLMHLFHLLFRHWHTMISKSPLHRHSNCCNQHMASPELPAFAINVKVVFVRDSMSYGECVL